MLCAGLPKLQKLHLVFDGIHTVSEVGQIFLFRGLTQGLKVNNFHMRDLALSFTYTTNEPLFELSKAISIIFAKMEKFSLNCHQIHNTAENFSEGLRAITKAMEEANNQCLQTLDLCIASLYDEAIVPLSMTIQSLLVTLNDLTFCFNNSYMTEAGLVALGRTFSTGAPNLKRLCIDITSSNELHEDGFQEFGEGIGALMPTTLERTTVNFYGGRRITDIAVMNFANGIKGKMKEPHYIQDVCFTACVNVSEEVVEDIEHMFRADRLVYATSNPIYIL